MCIFLKSILLITALLVISTGAFAAEPFYQGKTLRVVVASAAGGGSDIVARLMMRHLSRHIPGSPTIVVENMPGGGEIIGTNYVYGKAKPDGLTALFATGTPINQLIGCTAINQLIAVTIRAQRRRARTINRLSVLERGWG